MALLSLGDWGEVVIPGIVLHVWNETTIWKLNKKAATALHWYFLVYEAVWGAVGNRGLSSHYLDEKHRE